MTPRSLLSLTALAVLCGCATPLPVVGTVPFGSQGIVTGNQTSITYNSGIYSYTKSGTVTWSSDTSNGSYTAGAGNKITFAVTGTGVHLYGSRQAKGCASIPVTVDGNPFTMSCYLTTNQTTPLFNQPLLDVPNLNYGTHTVVVTNPVQGKYVYFYRAVVDTPPPVSVTATVTPGLPYSGPPVWGP